MKPSRHVITSTALGALVWHFTRSIPAVLICFIAGILTDIDHFIEYGIHFGWRKISVKNIYLASKDNDRGYGEHKFKALYVFFHVTELAVILWVVAFYTGNIYVTAAALGYSSHILLDMLGNKTYFYTYFLTGRILHNFDIDRLIKYKGHGKS